MIFNDEFMGGGSISDQNTTKICYFGVERNNFKSNSGRTTNQIFVLASQIYKILEKFAQM